MCHHQNFDMTLLWGWKKTLQGQNKKLFIFCAFLVKTQIFLYSIRFISLEQIGFLLSKQ
jgi:hypothetical protein